MKKISTWARYHPRPARVLIVLFFFMITGLGIGAGTLLDSLDIQLNLIWLYIFPGLYLIGILFYPMAGRKRAYYRQKSVDFCLATLTFLLIAFVSNRPDTLFNNIGNLYATELPPIGGDSAGKVYLNGKAFSKAVRDQDGKLLKWKERKKLLKTQVKAIKKANDMSQGAKIGLIILSVILAIGLAYGVAALACNISCSGSEAAAIVVAIGGLALVAFLLVIAIRAILGKKKRKRQEIEGPAGSTG